MDNKPKLLVQKSLLQMAENSIGASTFRNLYIEVNGEVMDALEDGDLSCAVFVTGLLSPFGLIDKGHATVKSTIPALLEAGWQEIEDTTKPEPADIILWDASKGIPNQHVGFYMGDHTAISNSSETRSPQRHHWTFGGKRQPVRLYRYNFSA